MAFFQGFKQVLYPIPQSEGLDRQVLLTNLVQRLVFRTAIQQNSSFFEKYIITDGDTAQDLASKLYGSANDFVWIVWLFNNILDPYDDWPLDQLRFREFVNRKYPGEAAFITPGTLSGTAPRARFLVGEDVTGTNGTGVVHQWDATLNKLVITDVLGLFQNGDTVTQTQGAETVTGTIGRHVSDHPSAVHHFADNDGKIVNPLDFKSNYIAGGNFFAVTNASFENTENDAKREIELLKPEFVELVNRELTRLLNEGPIFG